MQFKSVLFSLLAVLISTQSDAQSKAPGTVNLVNQTWKVDSLGSSRGQNADVSDKLGKELGSMSINFLENGRAWIWVDNEIALLSYDISKGSKGSYLNLSGVVMIYFQILEQKENSLVLGFQFPKTLSDGLMKFYLSKANYTLTDSLLSNLDGDYVMQDYIYSNGYDENGEPVRLYNTSHMRLSDDGKMTCNFGVLDTGTWHVDSKNMELRLQGQHQLYRFGIESYLSRNIGLKTLSGARDSVFYLYKSHFADFDDLHTHAVEVEEAPAMPDEYYDPEPEAMDTTAIDYSNYDYPEKTQSEILCNSWQAYAINENGEVVEMPKATYMIFYKDGVVSYNKGKKRTKGTWKLQESTQTLILDWGKKEEVAYYFWDYYYYDESYDTRISLNMTITPPGEKKAINLELRAVMIE